MNKIIFLSPIFKEAVWGGRRLREDYHYPTPSDRTGEAWVISAHDRGDCRVVGQDTTLGSLWRDHRELFGNIAGDRFPLLVKLIDANDDLSIQVHPDDAYAASRKRGDRGKTECWYVVDCKPNATVVIGHNARSRDELRSMILEGRWNELVREIPLKKGDFFQIEPGCLHAIKGGTLILETQQNSDVTYRLYDYGRLSEGKPRALQVEDGIAVIPAPFDATPTRPTASTVRLGDDRVTSLVKCKYYEVEKHAISGRATLSQPYPFLCVSVIEGSGVIDGHPIAKGDSFILPNAYPDASIEGELTLITSHV